MISKISTRFRRDFLSLPIPIQRRARLAFRKFQSDPQNPGLEFKPLRTRQALWSARITDSYRTVGLRSENNITWFFIGTHAEYDALIANYGR